MSKPRNPDDLDALRRLLDRLAAVDPKCMPDIIAGQWTTSHPDERWKIEEAIDRLPRRKKPH